MFTSLLVIVFIVILAYFSLYTYNKLAAATQYISTAWEELDGLLSHRYAVLAALIRKINSVTNREQTLVQKLIDVRYTAMLLQKRGADRSFQENSISTSVSDLCDLLKKYPQLKEDQQMIDLLKEFIAVTDQIQHATRLYNKTAAMINNLADTFPASLIADMWHFKRVDPVSFQETLLPDLDQLIKESNQKEKE